MTTPKTSSAETLIRETPSSSRGQTQETGTIVRPGHPDLHWRGYWQDSWQDIVPQPADSEHLDGKPPSRPILAFVHGLAEHFGRYGFPVDHFTRLGFPCYGIDLRGHGLSEGRRVHVDRFDEFSQDVDALIDLVGSRHPGLPVVLIGHSMGGVISSLYAMEYPDRLQGLILSSPGLKAHPETAPPALLLLIGKIASRLVPRLHISTGLDPALISKNPEVIEAYRNDPLVTSKVTARWATEFLSAQDRCSQQAARLRLPTLVMQSGADRLVDPATTRDWASRIPQEASQFQEWPGYYHEMFNEPEPERRQVFELMERWIAAQSF